MPRSKPITAQTPIPRNRPAAAAALRLRPPVPRALAYCIALAWCGLPLAVQAQAAAPSAWDEPLTLRKSPALQETIPESVRSQLPVFVTGDRISGQTDLNATIEGNAELRRGDTVIRADRLDYNVPEDLAKARGNVRINRAGNSYEGSALDLRVDAFEGFFTDARYRLLATQAHGEANRVDFIDRDRSLVHSATYTTCQRDNEASWSPAWVLRADKIRIDNEEEVGSAEGAVLEFQGVPVLPIPYITFPLSDKRKSGLLPPTIGLDSRDGLDYTQPYYWNIAPNRDATLRAALMTKRGANLGGEFRYLEPTYRGEINADMMPSDRLRDRARWGITAKHQGVIDSGIGGLGLNLNLNRVSDDNYWRDFGRASEPLRQRLLPNDAMLTWGSGDFSAQVRTLKWQTLQDVTSPIIPPYDRMPQLNWRYTPSALPGGLDASVELDTTRFEAARALTGQPNADRSYALAQISRPFLTPGGFVTPKLQLHTTQYQFDGALSNGSRSANRSLPTFSLDSGLVFERDANFLGRSFLQTLEPRAFYTYTPFRDQSRLPVYDTAANDFNFATVYTENAYGGNDRIADNNLLTLGVTTRLLDPDTGAENVRFGVAQRLRFSDQNVTLPGVAPVSERLSDVLVGAGVNWTQKWAFDSLVQYNPKTQRSIRSTVSARYSPGNYRTVSAAYRFQRGTSEQIDIGWQWPLNDLWGDKGQDLGAGRGQGGGRWYSVARLNYSMQDRKLVDTVVGLEYDSCCWIGRVVLERLQNSNSSSNTRLLFQLEFVGFSRLSLGASPLETFRQHVPRYQYLRDQVSAPSRFSNYDETNTAMNHRVMTLALAASLACLASQSTLAQGLRPSSVASKGLAPTPGTAAPAGKAPLALPTPSAADTSPRSADFIVAVVNSEPVTNYEVRSRVARIEQQLAQQGGDAPRTSRELITREVLERLILEKAQLQLAREMNIKVDDYAVNQAEASVAQQNGLTVSELQRRLVSEGLSRDRFREELRNQLLLQRVREREVDARVRVSDLDIDQFIRDQQGSEVSAAEINLAHVLVRVPEDASPDVVAERQARAQQAADKVRAGEDFAKVAREYSDAPEGRRDGGLLGMRPADRYPELFVTSTQNLPVGGVAGPVRSPAGFHILKVVERSAAGSGPTVVQTNARHILLRTGPQLSESAAAERLNDYRRRIQSGQADFATLAREHSQDSSAKQGGDLGWANPGRYVPEFEQALSTLRPGEISEPLVSRFGVHLIQLVDRREAKLNQREQRDMMRDAVREKKLEEAYATWAQELRGRAYVEYREPPQ